MCPFIALSPSSMYFYYFVYKFIFNSIESGLSGTVTVMLFLTAIDINANTIVALDYSFNRAYPDCDL